MPSSVVIGAQYGDEGKGKVVDLLGKTADLVVRFNGGNNAGHTVVVKGKTYKFHLMPSGAIQGKRCLVGAGTAIDPRVLKKELEQLEGQFKIDLGIDPRAQIIMPWHNALDAAKEISKGKAKIGTTGRGIGPCYVDRANRTGIRFLDLVDEKKLGGKIEEVFPIKEKTLKEVFGGEMQQTREEIFAEYSALGKELGKFLTDVSVEVSNAMDQGKELLFEGAQGTFLDNDFGTYPFVTSSHPISGGLFTGTGIGIRPIERVIGIVKAYTTRVGEGPFVTELEGEFANRIREKGQEFGTTTGRPRRVGWLDLPLLKTAQRLNQFTEIALTKIDVLTGLEEIQVCIEYDCDGEKLKEVPVDLEQVKKCKPVYRAFKGFEIRQGTEKFEELPKEARDYIKFIEEELKVGISIVSTGPGREETIVR